MARRAVLRAVGSWWNRFGPGLRRGDRETARSPFNIFALAWHLHEAFVRSNGGACCLWRAVGHEGEVLEFFATKHTDRQAAPAVLTRTRPQISRDPIRVGAGSSLFACQRPKYLC